MSAQSTMLALGTAAPDFSLPDVRNGVRVSLEDFLGRQALLVVFLCAHCPYVLHVRDELTRLQRDYTPRGLGTLGISANDVAQYPQDSPARLAALAREAGWGFPLVFDEKQTVAKAFTAACTPDFFLFDAAHRLAYRGQLDGSRPARGESRPGAGVCDGADLRAALDAVLAGWPVNADQRPSIGCSIKWKPGNAPAYAA